MKFTNKLIEKLRESSSAKSGDLFQAVLDVAYADWQAQEKACRLELKMKDESIKIVIAGEYEDMMRAGNEEHEVVGVKRLDHTWGQAEHLANCEKEYGKLARLIVQLGKYNQQVGNGGHIQYYDNGYASDGEVGFGSDHHGDLGRHQWMVSNFGALIQTLTEPDMAYVKSVFETAYAVMDRFEIELDDERDTDDECTECGGSGYVYPQGDDDDHERETCDECSGSGRMDVSNENYGSVTNIDLLNLLDSEWYVIDDGFVRLVELFLRYEIGKVDPLIVVTAFAADEMTKLILSLAVNETLYFSVVRHAVAVKLGYDDGGERRLASDVGSDQVILDNLNGYGWLVKFGASGDVLVKKAERSVNK